MKVLVTLYPKDAQGNQFVDCKDCAMSRAVKRVIKPELTVFEGIHNCLIMKGHAMSWIPHQVFDITSFSKLKSSPKGSFMVYEMDIPKEFLNETGLLANSGHKSKEVVYDRT